jgi:hypothetical protein
VHPLPPYYDDLAGSLDAAWTLLVRASKDRRSAMHTPVVACVDATGAPQARVMVLRQASREQALLRFHTDARSAKVMMIGSGAPVQVVAYDPGAKIQLRLSGTGRIETAGPSADAAWSGSQAGSLRCYLATDPPGADAARPTSGLPPEWEQQLPTRAEAAAGRANFAVLLITVDRLEWLYLAHAGHRRAHFVRSGEAWHGSWLIP